MKKILIIITLALLPLSTKAFDVTRIVPQDNVLVRFACLDKDHMKFFVEADPYNEDDVAIGQGLLKGAFCSRVTPATVVPQKCYYHNLQDPVNPGDWSVCSIKVNETEYFFAFKPKRQGV